MVKYIGKLGTVVVGLIIITRLDFGRSSCHLAANSCIDVYAPSLSLKISGEGLTLNKSKKGKLLGGVIKPKKKTNMAVSIMETLQNANYNMDNLKSMPMLLPMVKAQLNNAVTLLDKGYDIWEEVEPLLEKYGSVENVPEKDSVTNG